MIYKLRPEHNTREEMYIKEFELSKLKKTIMTKEKFLDTIKCKNNVKENTIIETLGNHLKNDKPEKVILVDWIRENFYDKHTTQETINSMYKLIKNKLNFENYKLVAPRGRGQKAYLEIKGELTNETICNRRHTLRFR